MKLDLTSFAFGFAINGSNGNPNWATALGQGAQYKINQSDSINEIVKGLIYSSVPISLVQAKIGKGGRMYNGTDPDSGIVLGSVFPKVYANGVLVPNCKLVVILTRDMTQSHEGRLRLKYSPHNKVLKTAGGVSITNLDQFDKIRTALGLSASACWFVYEMDVVDQDQLHLAIGVADAKANVSYTSTADLHDKWNDIIVAAGGMPVESPSNDEMYQVITYGAPGTGKSFRTKKDTDGHTVYRTTFHPDSDYSTFVGAYKPKMRPEQRINCIDDKAKAVRDADGKPSMQDVISYDFVPQAFIKAYVDAWRKWAGGQVEKEGGGGEGKAEPVFLVIEEINRGNCAQIFGDLFQLLDRNEEGYSEYAVDADADLARWLAGQLGGGRGATALPNGHAGRVTLPADVASGKKLVLPPNLYIRATMNTSDQSLFPIDSAFKRRWEWKYVPIAKPTEAGWKDRVIVCKWKEKDSNGQDVDVAKAYDWWEFLKIANAQILETTKSEDKQLGYFFVKAPDATGHIKADRFTGKVLFYLYNDVFKDYSLPATLFGDGTSDSIRYEFKMFFDEYGETIEKVVAAFLDQLKIPSEPLAGADGDGTPSLPTTAV